MSLPITAFIKIVAEETPSGLFTWNFCVVTFLHVCVCHEFEDCVFLRYGFITAGGKVQNSS